MGNTSKKEKYNRNSASFVNNPVTTSTTTITTTATTGTSTTTISQPTTPVEKPAETTTSQATSTTSPTKSPVTTSPKSQPTKPKTEKVKEEKASNTPLKDGPDDFQYSLVIIGESGVGKTALLHRFTNKKFNGDVQPTEGVDFAKQSVMVESKKVGLEIWDTAGDERTRVPTTFYQDCKGVLAVYDVNNMDSFTNLDKWIGDAEKFAKGADAKWLIGNKIDGERVVTTEQAREYAKSKGLEFFEVSAKNSNNVDDLFQNIGSVIKRQFNK
jgi:small GTP-binding protein